MVLRLVDGPDGLVRRWVNVDGPHIEVVGLRVYGRRLTAGGVHDVIQRAMTRVVEAVVPVVVLCSRLHSRVWRREFSRRGWSCACLARLDLRSEGWTDDEHVLRFEPGE